MRFGLLVRLTSIFCVSIVVAIYRKVSIELKEHEAYLALLTMIPANFHLYHVKGRQDESKNWENLTTPERLNVKTDLIATKHAKPPLNIPIH